MNRNAPAPNPAEKIVDGVHPKMSPFISFSDRELKQFLICSNPTSTQAGAHKNIFIMIFI